MLAGDGNVEPEESPTIQQMLATGNWHLLSEVQEAMTGVPSPPTCVKYNEQKEIVSESRIDWMIVNSRALDAFIQFHVDEDTSIPTHRPLIAQFNWALTEQTISAWKRPKRFPKEVDAHYSNKANNTIIKVLKDSDTTWQQIRQEEDTIGGWNILSADAETFLVNMHTDQLEGKRHMYTGRGQVAATEPRPVAAKMDKKPELGAATAKGKELGRLCNRMQQLHHRVAALKQQKRCHNNCEKEIKDKEFVIQSTWDKCRRGIKRLLEEEDRSANEVKERRDPIQEEKVGS